MPVLSKLEMSTKQGESVSSMGLSSGTVEKSSR